MAPQCRNECILAMLQLGYPVLRCPQRGGDFDLGTPYRRTDLSQRVVADEFLAARFSRVLDRLGLPRDPFGGVNGAICHVNDSRCWSNRASARLISPL